MPLCFSGEGCVAKHTVNPPATYAVQRFPVRPPRRFRLGVAGSVRVIACPSVGSLCGRKAICPENLANERPEARRVSTGHLASAGRGSRRAAESWRACRLQDVTSGSITETRLVYP